MMHNKNNSPLIYRTEKKFGPFAVTPLPKIYHLPSTTGLAPTLNI